MIAPGLDVNLDHELNRGRPACDVVTQSDSVGLISALLCGVLAAIALPTSQVDDPTDCLLQDLDAQ
jgi:hypothetical protein